PPSPSTLFPYTTLFRSIVLMFCDFINRKQLAREQLPQDLLYLLTLYGDPVSEAILGAGGTLATVGLDGICALFGLDHQSARADGDRKSTRLNSSHSQTS